MQELSRKPISEYAPGYFRERFLLLCMATFTFEEPAFFYFDRIDIAGFIKESAIVSSVIDNMLFSDDKGGSSKIRAENTTSCMNH